MWRPSLRMPQIQPETAASLVWWPDLIGAALLLCVVGERIQDEQVQIVGGNRVFLFW